MSIATVTLLLRGLDLLVLGVEMAPEIRAAFQDMTANVRLMVEEGRDPSLEEWAQLDDLRDAIHDTIQAAHPE